MELIQNRSYLLSLVVLGVTGLITVLALISAYPSGAADTNANVNIDNDPPTISVVERGSSLDGAWTPGDSLVAAAGTNNVVTVNADVTDTNGFANQTITVTAVADRTSSSGTVSEYTCTGHDHNCLPRSGPATCTQLTAGATTRRFSCAVPIRYNSDPTSTGTQVQPGEDYVAERWDFIIRANDTVVNVDNKTSFFDYDEVVGLLLSSGSDLDLGTVATDGGETPDDGSNGINLTVLNRGNTEQDWTTEASSATDSVAWTCTGSGNPLISDLKYDLGFATPYASMTSVTPLGSPATTQANFDRSPDNATTSNSLYWRFATTQTITPGVCTFSSVIMSAIKST